MNLRPRVCLLLFLSTAVAVWSAVAASQAQLKPGHPAAPSSPAAGSMSRALTATIPEPGEIFRDCPDCSELVVVPAGEFKMGSRDHPHTKPEHRVVLAVPFAL